MAPKKFLYVLGLVTALGFWLARPVHAEGPPADSACRGCHDKNQGELTLPSGEILPLVAPVEAIEQSPHRAAAKVLCTSCHTGKVHYQYPHQPTPAQTRRDFRLAVTQNCQACHYPHRPFHPTDSTSADLPNCVDCHGSHNIDPVGNILNQMPAACVTCHADQTTVWATKFIAPRRGLGQPADGYIGSYRCGGCHDDLYRSWRDTPHARTIQDPAADPAVILGDFSQANPALTFKESAVAYTVGNQLKQQYLTRDDQGNIYVLPAQWIIATKTWEAYGTDEPIEWRHACAGCHVTGLNTATWGFAEFGIGCENCHGPGAAHAADPKKIKPYAKADSQVCGACHSRGTSPDGLPFPATYHPGDTLTDHFTFTTAATDIWPDGSAKHGQQQYLDWQLGNDMAKSGLSCATCHRVHEAGQGQAQLVAPLNDLCLQCHADKKQIVNHMPYHDRAIAKHQFLCTDCHMPKMATDATPNDLHNHSFLQPNPQASLDHGGVEAMPNACNICHTKLGEDARWAANTIVYAKTQITPVPSAFGPGPTPTPPPPPTPLPSVGQQAAVEQVQVESGRWVRYTFFVILGIIVLGLVYLLYRYIKARRLRHA